LEPLADGVPEIAIEIGRTRNVITKNRAGSWRIDRRFNGNGEGIDGKQNGIEWRRDRNTEMGNLD